MCGAFNIESICTPAGQSSVTSTSVMLPSLAALSLVESPISGYRLTGRKRSKRPSDEDGSESDESAALTTLPLEIQIHIAGLLAARSCRDVVKLLQTNRQLFEYERNDPQSFWKGLCKTRGWVLPPDSVPRVWKSYFSARCIGKRHERRTLNGGWPVKLPETLTSAALSADGSCVLIPGFDAEHNCAVIDIHHQTGTFRHILDTITVTSIAVTPDGRSIVCGTSDGTVTVRDFKNGEETHRMSSGLGAPVVSIAATPDSAFIATGGPSKAYGVTSATVQTWELGSGQLPSATIESDRGVLSTVVVTPDGASVLASLHNGGGGGYVCKWDMPRLHAKFVIQVHDLPSPGIRPHISVPLAVTPDNWSFIVAGDTYLHVFDMQTGRYRTMICNSTQRGSCSLFPVYSVAVTPDGSQIIGAMGDRVRVWEAAEPYRVVQTLRRSHPSGLGPYQVHWVATVPDGLLGLVGLSAGAQLCQWGIGSYNFGGTVPVPSTGYLER